MEWLTLSSTRLHRVTEVDLPCNVGYAVAGPGFPVGGGADLRRIHFLAKKYAKTKEMDPVGGGGAHAGSAPLDPPMLCTPYIQGSG